MGSAAAAAAAAAVLLEDMAAGCSKLWNKRAHSCHQPLFLKGMKPWFVGFPRAQVLLQFDTIKPGLSTLEGSNRS
jgi:hypothetical protein